MAYNVKKFFLELWRFKGSLVMVLTPLLLLPLPLVINTSEAKCAYVMILMAVYWITEVIPIAITSLLPMVLLPLMGVMESEDLAKNYMKDTQMLFVGGLIVAVAIEKSNLHRRIALGVLLLVGSKPQWLMLGFMLPTWFLSMWISNTATTAMMIPVVEAVLQQLTETRKLKQKKISGETPLTGPSPRNSDVSLNGVPAIYSVREDKDASLKYDVTDLNGDTHSSSFPTKESLDVEDQVFKQVDLKDKGEFEVREASQKGDISGYVPVSKADKEFIQLCKGMSLCVCYSANVGGMSTITGTGPNLIMKGQVDLVFQKHGLESSGVNFTTWMLFGLPIACICLILAWIWLQIVYYGPRKFLSCFSKDKNPDETAAVKRVIRAEYEKLGKMKFREVVTLAHFVMLALLWLTREPEFIPGWAAAFTKGYVTDATPALFIAILLFLMPIEWPEFLCCRTCSKTEKGKSKPVDPLMDWYTVQHKLPWSVILLLGGGYALADASGESGLSKWISQQLVGLSNLNPVVMVLVICISVALFTEITSNSAVTTLLMPILADVAEAVDVNPLYLMFPAAISASFAFMLPVATPPNAIVFSYGRVKVIDMAKAGIGMNILCVLVVTLAVQTWGMAFFNLDKIPWETNPTNVTTAASINM
ncbi:unnamed protein product [Owenia fusiformis]|uniref:Uncharacterized protein n=1 Tax=Owenia fusiformis TaxID=6347 RepID=A0A8S4Q798_OWEFU|nr:unnamed protein product [Owenia fusiformis]